MSGTLHLAASIAAMERAELEALVELRPPAAPGQIVDSIGLALDLLREDSIGRAIEAQDRIGIAALESGGRAVADAGPDVASRLRQWGLVGLDGAQTVTLPEVTAAVETALHRRGDAEAHSLPAPRDRPADLSAWYAPAFVETQRAAAILRALSRAPGKANRRGDVSVTSARALAEASRSDPGAAAHTLTTLRLAGLIAVTGQREASERRVVVTSAVPGWLGLPHSERWLALARARVSAVGPSLRRTVAAVDGDVRAAASGALLFEYPLSSERTVAAANEFSEAAEHLGLTLDGFLTGPAAKLWNGTDAGVLESIAAALPDPAAGVYLQPDLTVVAPGPLAPEDEASLFALSAAEQLGVASTFRLSEATILRALDSGWTIDETRQFFERLSLTGVPQPLEFLLADLAERAGSITVHLHHGDAGRSEVRVTRSGTSQRLTADRALRHLRLETQIVPSPEGDGVSLFSPLAPEHVHAALIDARYPARLAADSAPAVSPPAPVPDRDTASPEQDELVERVYASSRSEPGTGDFTRHLELAIRDRQPVRVFAEARGSTHTFTLQPLSISGGRLRAADQSAGVERTLPITAITGVESV